MVLLVLHFVAVVDCTLNIYWVYRVSRQSRCRRRRRQCDLFPLFAHSEVAACLLRQYIIFESDWLTHAAQRKP